MIHASMNELIKVYAERELFVTRPALDGGEIIVFDSVFVSIILSSLMDGCLVEFTEAGLEMFYNLIKYEDGEYTDNYVIALDEWLSNLANGIENPTKEECSI